MPRTPKHVLLALLASALLAACSSTSATSTSKTGAACATDADCGTHQSCVYAIADGCAATRSCRDNPTGPICNVIVMYCGCDGSDVGVGCGEPGGYASAPVTGQKRTAICPGGAMDAGRE